MNIEKARLLAQEYLDKKIQHPDGDVFILVDGGVIEEKEGWYFSFQSKKYLDTKDMNFFFVGNWPIFVETSGRVHGPRRPDGW